MRTTYKHHGWITIELVIGIGIVLLIAACIASGAHTFGKINRRLLTKMQCTSAAQAQLDSFTVTGKPVEQQVLERLWPGIQTDIRQTTGTGQWQGLSLVKVTATGKCGKRQVHAELSRYVLIRPEQN